MAGRVAWAISDIMVSFSVFAYTAGSLRKSVSTDYITSSTTMKKQDFFFFFFKRSKFSDLESPRTYVSDPETVYF